MALSKIECKENGEHICPTCGEALVYVEGEAVSVVDGKIDMESVKPKYECDKCAVFFREVMNTGYYDVFPLEKNKAGESSESNDLAVKEPVELKTGDDGVKICPVCKKTLRYVEGGAVQVIDGKVDMDSVKPKYECDDCNVFYREVLTSGYYLPYPMQTESTGKKNENSKKKVVSTGDLQPVILKRDENNQCVCPRCGEMMDYIDSEAVKIVDGKADLENVKAHFLCNNCNSVFRRIVNTDFYQWAEK